eukprot:c16946_g2_i1.p1 GENE.c16946_g2_i1~~c16946_g2_i1.p1  ORF type:complete len:304 (-),score=148.85 c16946_g2_i1:76-963(-)
MAKLIDGKAIAATIRDELKAEVQSLKEKHNLTPGLAVVLVGNRPDSATYVRMKKKSAEECLFHSVDVQLPETVSQKELTDAIEALNNDPAIHGILVQLPLPKHINESQVLSTIKLEKDVDGFLPENIGRLVMKGVEPPLALPCTPAGCIELLKRSNIDVNGMNAVVIGRSNIVGMPVANMLLALNATVTVCHSRTKNIESYVQNADLVVAAIGKAMFVKGEWIKPGAVVIDVGINTIADATKKSGTRMVGDVDFEEASKRASYITPVPGGVGPMTIAMLLKNTVNLARHTLKEKQ